MAALRSGRASSAPAGLPPEATSTGREIERAGDVELVDRRAVVEQCQKLNLRRPQTDVGLFQFGFVLHALEFDPVQIDLGEVARREPFAAERDHWS